MFLMSRRAMLARAAISGAALTAGLGWLREALAQGEIKPGVARARGGVSVNGASARVGAGVRPGDVIETARSGEAVVVVNRDAFLVRGGTKLEMGGGGSPVAQDSVRVLAGKVLSVFTPGKRMEVSTRTATIGIRGTGLYVEVVPECTYACTCYGAAHLSPLADAARGELVTTKYHDAPRYIYASAEIGKGRLIEVAPVVNHQDAELVMLETLVGRKVPFEPGRY